MLSHRSALLVARLRRFVPSLLLAVAFAACATSGSPPASTALSDLVYDPIASFDTIVDGERVYLVSEVDSAARAIPGFGPAYPRELKAADVTGGVIAVFIIDTTGRAEIPSINVIASGHGAFTQSVVEHLRTARYAPAVRGGRRVRMWARQAFEFRLACWRENRIAGVPECPRVRSSTPPPPQHGGRPNARQPMEPVPPS